MRIAAPVVSAFVLLCHVAAVKADEQVARKARDVLKAHCYRCHGQDGVAEGGFNYVLDLPKLVSRNKVVPGNPAKSKLLKRILSSDDPMPPAEEKLRPGQDDIAILTKWIEAGAVDFQQAPAKRAFITAADMIGHIATDLEKVNERDRPFTRYFTLTHLHNAGLSADELRSYRHGLSKLVNSLSWGNQVVVPPPIDPAQTVFRIDLRDYQWNEKVWDAILAQNPYGVQVSGASARYCATVTRTTLPFVRGDWFVAAAARPPLYHDVLQLPRTEQELEKMLRVDTLENIRQERVARAGFNSSGVSRNNRLIERHESGHVVYWKSYDFAGNTGRQNLFAQPLGPGTGFQHDGGEIIFNLPNGLQAYLLADARGRRLDKGPTAIVSDPRRPDRAVENGLSCMSCHARGLIDKADQVREHVLKNAQAFARQDVDTILTLYPPRATMTGLIRKDARRFQEAVAKTGAPLSATEPVAALALRFEAELDLPLAAAEAGVPPDTFLQGLERYAALAQQLGALKVEGGTVQRQVFVDSFPDLVRALRLGEVLDSGNKSALRWIMLGDRLLRQGDPAAAVKAYSEALAIEPDNALAHVGRGDARRQQGDVNAAIADYSQALRLDPRLAIAFNNRGLLHSRKGEHERAIADFTAALRCDPSLGSAHHNRAAAHFGKGDVERALTDYTEAVRLNPASAVSFNNRGFAYFHKGDLELAIADYNEALRLDPDFAVALNNRGLAHSRKNDHDRAIADFSAALRLDPKFAKAWFNRGLAHVKNGDAAQADADRREAVRLDPTLDK